MSDETRVASRFRVRDGTAWEHAPIQLPGRVTRLRVTEVGGPRAGRDTRMILDRAELAKLTRLAESSLSGRVVLLCVGVEVSLWQTPAGHCFETWRLIAAEARPEQSVMDSMIRGSSAG